ncbi:hypothetical protein PUR61_02025 [Streptomyces sp. BE20]|uniref:hypothetical protein n=1 Tax=Streptomyces sp. BE20 TaxID=3002525 RepID=UPI002E76A0A6|nr:hypothetical protein [Streptomyces sp. BE20]MEE1820984.1 hypothetical protein [Streptomyces sp. BE20]
MTPVDLGPTRDHGEPLHATPQDPGAVADRTGVAAALLVSATSPLAGVRATANSGVLAVTCSYTAGSFTRASPTVPGRGRPEQDLLATVLPGARTGEARVFLESRLHPAVVAAAGGWRAFTLQAHGWLLLAVVPDRPGEGTAPHLRLVRPAATGAGLSRGAA